MSNENEAQQATVNEDLQNQATEQTTEQVAENTSTEASVDMVKELEAMTMKIKQLEDDIAKAKDDYLRGQAELQNMRRRCEQEVDKAKKFAIDRFVKDLLPALDPVEKALEFANRESEECKNLVMGVESTFNILLKALNANGVEVINPVNQEVFDPNLHQAIQSLENPQVPANHVMAVVQKGYQLSGRVLRPAMVIVSKGSSEQIVEVAV